MSAMVLCPACSRHIFARELACPFCGTAVTSKGAASPPSLSAELSRAQRYAIGAALAASVATAACSSPTKVHDANDLVVDTNARQDPNLSGGSSGGSHQTLEVATDPNDPNLVAEDEAARQKKQEQERQRQLDLQKRQDWQERHWQNHQCQNGVCPPYGCVFPDEACDVLRV